MVRPSKTGWEARQTGFMLVELCIALWLIALLVPILQDGSRRLVTSTQRMADDHESNIIRRVYHYLDTVTPHYVSDIQLCVLDSSIVYACIHSDEAHGEDHGD